MDIINKTYCFVFILFCSQLLVSQENLVNRKSVSEDLPVTPIVEDVTFSKNGNNPIQDETGREMWARKLAEPKHTGVESITISNLPRSNYEDNFKNKEQTDFFELLKNALILVIIILILIFGYKFYNRLKGNIPLISFNTKNNKVSIILTQLDRINQLKKDGLISEEEYNTLKKAILN